MTVIEVGEKNDVNLRQICETFEISKNQMSNSIIEDDKNLTTVVTYAKIKWQTVKFRKTESPKNDLVLFNWFCSIKPEKFLLNNFIFQEKFKEFAEVILIMNSKALNGFLEKIKLQHKLSFKAVYFEENSVDPQQVAY